MSELHSGTVGGWGPAVHVWDQRFHACLHQPHGMASCGVLIDFNARKTQKPIKTPLLKCVPSLQGVSY